MRAPKKLRVTERRLVLDIGVVAKGDGDTEQNATVALSAVPSSANVSVVLLNSPVSAPVSPGNGRTTFNLDAELRCTELDGMVYTVTWTATISAAENGDPTNDTVTATSAVSCVAKKGGKP